MKNSQSSLTSLGAASLRVAHQLLDGEPKVLRDAVILKMLDPSILDRIREYAPYYREPGPMVLRAHVVLRSRYAEDRLAQAYARGIRQYLLLGAGLDTFAWRQPDGMEELTIFEADHPATQTQKRQWLAQAGLAVPDNCRFIPVNFETDPLQDVLQTGGLDLTKPVFISWLGVTVYLSMEAIDTVFRWVVGLPASSEIVFTFSQKGMPEILRPSAAWAAEADEPWKTFIRPEDLGWKLCKMGYSSLSVLQPEEAKELYFSGRGDGLAPPLRGGIASAIV
jgi:methyltransferase (TIGR00027 family)